MGCKCKEEAGKVSRFAEGGALERVSGPEHAFGKALKGATYVACFFLFIITLPLTAAPLCVVLFRHGGVLKIFKGRNGKQSI